MHDAGVAASGDASVELFNGSERLTDKELTELGRPIWEWSRYAKDTEIPKEQSILLYRTWIENSMYNGYANACFVAREKNKIVGLCTINMKNRDGYIDLLGVLQEYRGKHIGSRLVESAISYCANKVKRMFVVTEGENIPANRLYQQKGFIIDKVELVYHKHV